MSKEVEHQGTKNLIPMSERSKEEVKEIAARGGRKSGETRRKKRDMRALMKELLYSPINESEDSPEQVVCERLGIDPKLVENRGQLAAITAYFQTLNKGDVAGLTQLFNMAGEDLTPAVGGSAFDPNDPDTMPVVVVQAKEIECEVVPNNQEKENN